jgi:hypothetical protein
VGVPDHPDVFEVKLYTLAVNDMPDNYRDKIYLGRDFLSMKGLRREHLGLKNIRNSSIDQFLKLRARLKKYIPAEMHTEINSEYLQEIEELIGEFAEEANHIIAEFPAEISTHDLEQEALIRVNSRFRELKHILIEIEESAREMEERLFDEDHSHAVRYVTKFKKDVTNNINYILFKINGRISDSLNKIHL